jgi:hypothetical protein
VAARRLLAAATLAGSVFGGSGSWSDQDYGERQAAYRAVTEGLFDATQTATLAFAGKTDWTTGFFAPALAMLSSAEGLFDATQTATLAAVNAFGVER